MLWTNSPKTIFSQFSVLFILAKLDKICKTRQSSNVLCTLSLTFVCSFWDIGFIFRKLKQALRDANHVLVDLETTVRRPAVPWQRLAWQRTQMNSLKSSSCRKVASIGFVIWLTAGLNELRIGASPNRNEYLRYVFRWIQPLFLCLRCSFSLRGIFVKRIAIFSEGCCWQNSPKRCSSSVFPFNGCLTFTVETARRRLE